MPKTLYIGDDITTAETKVLFDERDFLELVKEQLGRDASEYLERLISAKEYDQYRKGWGEGYDDGFHDGLADTEECE